MAKKNTAILIIDENNHRKNTLSSRLRALGHVIDSATGGFHGLHLVEKTPYNLVLLFDDMNDMSAVEIHSIIRTRSPSQKLPIIILRSEAHKLDQQELELLEQAGLSDVCEWRDEFPTLLKKIQQFSL